MWQANCTGTESPRALSASHFMFNGKHMQDQPVRKLLFRWQEGARKSGYFVMPLMWVEKKYSPIPFDMYILKYPEGSSIRPHRDPLGNSEHYRINVFLTRPPGGEFVCENPIFQNSRIALFRPDVSTHSVTEVLKGTRYVWSFGWSWSKKNKARLARIKQFFLVRPRGNL